MAGDDPDRQRARALARGCGTFHNISYYCPEIRDFRDVGIPRYWHAYVAYRSAPMGRAPASLVTAAFYNFAPRMIAEAVPAVWDHVTPAQAIALRDDAVDRALRRSLGDRTADPALAEAADLARRGIEGCDLVGRPLFAAHCELAPPDEPHMALFHACTLWREHRGDAHLVALAAAELDGIECHVLLAGRGVADPTVIEEIRGWSHDEWRHAHDRLAGRGLLAPDGSLTDAGRRFRADVEAHTDRLAAEPRHRLGADRSDRLVDLLAPLVDHLVGTGAVAGRWPPDRPPS